MVAECNNDETGVGPSIASGNHVCKNNCADFAHAAIAKKITIINNKLHSGTKIFIKLVSLTFVHVINNIMPKSRNTSPSDLPSQLLNLPNKPHFDYPKNLLIKN